MSHPVRLSLVITLALAFAAPGLAEGPDWAQFRGPDRDGMSSEDGLLETWPEEGPTELWRRDIGPGYAGISIADGRLFTMYATTPPEGETSMEVAAALDPNTGEEIWQTPLAERLDTEFGNGPRSTPTVDGDTVFVLSSHGDLAALATDDGSIRWEVSFQETYGANLPSWGFSTSPMVDGDLLFVQAGGPDGKSHVALDKATGETLWSIGSGNGYNSPLPITMHGQRQYVYIVGTTIGAVSPDGEELWSMDWPRGETHATPIFLPPNRIYASGAEGVGGTVLEITPDGDGPAKVERIWESNTVRNHFNQSIVIDGHVYGFDNATFKCISVDDGSMQWRQRGLGKGSLVSADGRLFVLSDKGKLLLVEPTPDGFSELGAVQALTGKSWTPPTIHDGRIYLRNHSEMVVFDIKG